MGSLAYTRRFVSLGKPPLWTVVALPATIVATASLSVLPPLFIGAIVDALQRRDANAAIHQLLAYICVTGAFGLVGLANGYASSVFRETLARNLRLALLGKLNRARFDALSRLTVGEIGNRLTNDVSSMCAQLQYSLFPTLAGVCTLVATIVAMLREDARMTLVAFVSSLLIVVPLRIAAPRAAALRKRQSEAGDHFYGTLSESATLGALASLRNASAARTHLAYLQEVTQRILRTAVLQDLVGQLASFGSSIAGMLGPGAIMAIGVYLVVRGEITSGKIVTMLIYQARMAAPFAALSSLQITLATIEVIARRLLDVADLPEEVSGSRRFVSGRLVAAGVGAVRGERTVLDDVNVAIERGLHAAFIGPSGAGKSIFTALLSRLYDPDRGSVTIGGVDLREFTLDSLRAEVSIVAQEPLVFDASLFDNITLANPDATPAQIDKAVALCRLDDVLSRLPDGRSARLGQRGFRLSGGERQRVCLARALLQGPSVLILDEALTGVDVEMERAILHDLRALFAGRTLVVVTHRLASIAGFDLIVAFDEGRVVAQGTHDEMLRASEWYRTLSASFDVRADAAMAG